LPNAKYITHEGKLIEFNVKGGNFTLNPLPLRSFAVEPQVLNNQVSGFLSGNTTSYPVELGVVGKTIKETADNYDYLLNLFEDDIEAVSPGTLVVNGYSLKCYINGITPSISMRKGKTFTATITTDNPLWYKELSTVVFTPDMSFIQNTPPANAVKPINYPHNYPYDYGINQNIKIIDNKALRASHFRLIIEGFVSNPIITIGGHIYSVAVEVPELSQLIINSREGTITLIDENGSRTNAFDKRNRESNVFQKIPSGKSEVLYKNISKFYLTPIEERRFPPWKN
jgi:hypothetical protein